MEKKYIVYRITNALNNKSYIGAHAQHGEEDDGYMGSGVLIRRAIAKHGIENFHKEVLASFDNPEDMFSMESRLVTTDYVKICGLCYNLKEGGNGGWLGPAGASEAGRRSNKLRAERIASDPEFAVVFQERMRVAIEKLNASGKVFRFDANNRYDWTGKKHSEASKEKMSRSMQGKNKGKANGQYGTCWVHNPIKKVSTRINKNDLNEYITKGWVKGRKIKW